MLYHPKDSTCTCMYLLYIHQSKAKCRSAVLTQLYQGLLSKASLGDYFGDLNRKACKTCVGVATYLYSFFFGD